MKENRYMTDISIRTNYKLINVFFILCFLFDFAVTFSVAKYNYEYFANNEINTQFIAFVNGEVFSVFFIIFINLCLFLPFIFVGRWYYTLDMKDRTDRTNFYAYINCAILSLAISIFHVYGGLSWLVRN